MLHKPVNSVTDCAFTRLKSRFGIERFGDPIKGANVSIDCVTEEPRFWTDSAGLAKSTPRVIHQGGAMPQIARMDCRTRPIIANSSQQRFAPNPSNAMCLQCRKRNDGSSVAIETCFRIRATCVINDCTQLEVAGVRVSTTREKPGFRARF